MKIALSFIGCHGRGGVERLLLETANFLARRDHEVHVFASEFDAAALHPAAIRHPVRALTRPSVLRFISFANRCREEIESLDPQAGVHGSFGVVSPCGGVMNVQSVHRAWLDASRRLRNFSGRMRQACNPVHPLVLALEQRHFGRRNYKKLVAPTQQVKLDLMRFYRVPSEDIAIVPNGFAPEQLNFARSDSLRAGMRAKLGYKDRDFVVLFVANELERKGFGPLVRAIAALKNPRFHLLAVAGRANPDGYRAEIRKLGLEDRVKFTGAKSDLAPYYAAADVFALPTQYEAWGLVIVEALACGTPVLTSRLAGAAVAVSEGETGELLDCPTDIAEIAAKLDLIASAGRRYLARSLIAASVEAFTWDRVLGEYERVLCEAEMRAEEKH